MKNKTKLTVRFLALLLATLMVLPTFWLSAPVATLSFGEQRFEGLTVDKALTTGGGFHLNKKGMELMAYRMLPLLWEIAVDSAQ